MAMTAICASAAMLAVLASPGLAEDLTPLSYQTLLSPLVEGGSVVLGAPLAYPEVTPNVSSSIVTVQRGVETGWHEHEDGHKHEDAPDDAQASPPAKP